MREESYTSKASFLDLDPIPDYKPNDEEAHVFRGKRIGRRNRLYRTKDGRIICADVNGAYNVLRKSRPDAFSEAKGVAPSGSSPRTTCCLSRANATKSEWSLDRCAFRNYNMHDLNVALEGKLV